jgi:hypothetical protein
MDTMPPTQMSPLPSQKKFPLKLFSIIGGVILVAIVSIGMMVVLQPKETKQPSQQMQSSQQNADENDVIPSTADTKKEPIAIATEVYTAIANEEYMRVVGYFYIHQPDGYTKEQVLTLLDQDRKELSDPTGYHPTTSPQNVMVIGTKAQVRIDYQKSGKIYTARYDMEQMEGNWKIMSISYNKPLDLLRMSQQEETLKQALSRATYASTPTTFTLPNGDQVVVEKTLVSANADEDIKIHAVGLKDSYVVAVYDQPRIRSTEKIAAGRKEPDDRYTFDYRDFADNEVGLLLFYRADTQISTANTGIPTGALLQIPIKVTK